MSLRSALIPLTNTLNKSFSTTSSSYVGQTSAITSRAIVFASHGEPTEVLKGHHYELPIVGKGEVRIEFECVAINPADLNVIQGVYPSKPVVRTNIGPEPLSIMGNEGCGIVRGYNDGEEVGNLKIGDRVVMGRPQLGTWQSHANLALSSLIPLPSLSPPLTPIQASTISINPPTAYRLLSDFVPFNPKNLENRQGKGKDQWVIQNGGNSAVGEAVIQIAKAWGVRTINLVRDRDDIDTLKLHLKSLGADYVMTYSEFLKRETRAEIKTIIRDGELLLGLNCVGGKETTAMAKLLGAGGTLVTYGAMSLLPLSLPPSLFIFKQLTSTGFWLSHYNRTHTLYDQASMLSELSVMLSEGSLKEPDCEVVELEGGAEEEGRRVREAIKKRGGGKGRKVLLKWI